MDEIVKQAMAKWPNVPHCYGWLALDARGAWRMRDERAQQLGLPGEKLTHPALLAFINRNYSVDERGCWFFQNGPQRVYVALEAAPYIARTDPQAGWRLHTGETMGALDAAWMREAGTLLLAGEGKLAQLDDRDLASLLPALELEGKPANDEALCAWLAGGPGVMTLSVHGQRLPLRQLAADAAPAQWCYIRNPHPPPI
jgi:hypothetical protein